MTIDAALRSCLAARPLGWIAVAVSGGADSMVLLHAAAGFCGRRLVAAHFDHQIRAPAEHERELLVVRGICDELAVPLLIGRAGRGRIDALAGERGGGFEDAARAARYRFLVAACRATGAELLLTAHIADDQAETVLMRLLAGVRGPQLAGLRARSTVAGVEIARPLLGVRRQEIVRYAGDKRLRWCEDPSNRDERHRRNAVRWRILPALEEAWPAVRDDLLRLGQAHARQREQVEELLEGITWDERPGRVEMDAGSFFGLPDDARLELLYGATRLLGVLSPGNRPGHAFFRPLLGSTPARDGVVVGGRNMEISVRAGRLVARRAIV